MPHENSRRPIFNKTKNMGLEEDNQLSIVKETPSSKGRFDFPAACSNTIRDAFRHKKLWIKSDAEDRKLGSNWI